jgi:DNA ligase (NAD+)
VNYPNRDALVRDIEAQGGKTAGSVSAKTSYLINNDLLSNSGKNKKARELGIPVISEEDMIRWLRDGVRPE